MIYLTPEGGLCNRMRSIASVWHLAIKVDQPMTVNWWLTNDMNCSFGQLFEAAAIPFAVRELNAVGIRAPLFKVASPLTDLFCKWIGTPVLSSQVSASLVNQEAKLTAWGKAGSPRIRTNSKILDAPNLFGIFAPNKGLQTVIDRYKNDLPNSVGVHIRRSDNAKSTEFSSTQSFIAQMHLELKKNPQTRFFIATDSPETFARLQDEFGGAVYQHLKRSLSRDDSAAICDAVVDLYCLAGCRKLIGSYWSSFSDTAWEINGIDHIIINDSVRADAI